METELGEFDSDYALEGLRPALRGWKPITHRLPDNPQVGLRPALRGWKPQGAGAGNNDEGNSLRPALRGWKPLCRVGLVGLIGTSPTRLEGMETVFLIIPFAIISWSPTRLEGMETSLIEDARRRLVKVSDPP